METTDAAAPRDMRVFFIVWSGQLISMFGSGLTSFALGVWIYQQTKQATPFVGPAGPGRECPGLRQPAHPQRGGRAA